MQNKKKLIITFFSVTSIVFGLVAQPIPPYFFAQNGWMYDSLGNVENCRGEKVGLKCKLWGKIHQNNTWNKVAASGVKLIRYGGEHADENMPTRHQYLQMIDSARAHGIDILLQVPYNNNYYTADTAAALVKYINVTMKRKVKFWSIGNEPDLPPPNGYGYYSASPIADYTRHFATKMKAVDSTIITLGPELTYYDDRNNLISELTQPGGYFDITGRVPGHSYYYIDIVTFHSYPFGGDQKREQLITNLRDPWHIQHMLTTLNKRLDSCNLFHGREGKDQLRIALTETNLNYINSKDDKLNAHSFIAGQFWCELMAVGLEQRLHFLGFWSVIENSLGYIDENSGRYWPTYHHYKLAATNLRGTYYKVRVQDAPNTLKALASADSSTIVLLVMNQEDKKSRLSYRFEINTSTKDEKAFSQESGGAVLHLPRIPGLNGTLAYSDEIGSESTQLLVFDYRGKLLKKYSYSAAESEKGPRLETKLKQPKFFPSKVKGTNE